MKIRKFISSVFLAAILGIGLGLIFSGCSSTNSILEKAHIMNDGCFITCYNKNIYVPAKNIGKQIKSIKNNAILKSSNANHNINNPDIKRIYG
jgi:hypothetical protein